MHCVETYAPIPPSTNHLYRNLPNGGRAKTAAYRTWLKEAGKSIKAGMTEGEWRRWYEGTPPQGYEVQLIIDLPKNRDLDNIIKPILDALVNAGILTDDRHVHRINVERGDAFEKECLIIVQQYDPTGS